jgi:RNA polymerase sigma factor (sigma-70 family)
LYVPAAQADIQQRARSTPGSIEGKRLSEEVKPMYSVLRHLRRAALFSGNERPSDPELLKSFLIRHDEAAFEALMRRHGPMVLGVCMRILKNCHDPEDAFQATFLVLVRKAGSLRSSKLLAGWLYGVAYRTALKAHIMSIKRRAKEKAAQKEAPSETGASGVQDELLERLDAELSRLPEKYRVPVVLCELEGRSRKDAARLLGLPEGTLSWRLAHARKLLARKLSRPDITFSAGALAVALAGEKASAGVPAALLTATARAAIRMAAGQVLVAGMVSAEVAILTEGVLKAMLMSKLKMAWGIVLAISVSAGTAGLTYRAMAEPPPQARESSAARSMADDLEALRLEVEALRKSLQATRERVKTLESEMRAQKAQGGLMQGGIGGGMGQLGSGGVGGFSGGGQGLGGGQFGFSGAGGFSGGGFSGGSSQSGSVPDKKKPKAEYSSDPLSQAEAALRRLRQHPGDKHTTDVLEEALKQLREQSKQRRE